MTQLRSVGGTGGPRKKSQKFNPKKRWRGLTSRQRTFIMIGVVIVFVFGYSLIFMDQPHNSSQGFLNDEIVMPGSTRDARPKFRVKDLCVQGVKEVPMGSFILVCE